MTAMMVKAMAMVKGLLNGALSKLLGVMVVRTDNLRRVVFEVSLDT